MATMVISNPVPSELHGRPFIEQARALPARAALEAFSAAAAGFTDDSPAGSAFLGVLERLALVVFRGDTGHHIMCPCPGRDPREAETPPTILGRRLGALFRRRGGGRPQN